MTREQFTAAYIERVKAIEASEFDDATHDDALRDMADFLFDAFGTATGVSAPREMPESPAVAIDLEREA